MLMSGLVDRSGGSDRGAGGGGVATVASRMGSAEWFASRVELVVEPGAHGYMEFGDQGGPVHEVVDPPTRFSFTEPSPAGRSR